MERPDLTTASAEVAQYIAHLEGIIEGAFRVLELNTKPKMQKKPSELEETDGLPLSAPVQPTAKKRKIAVAESGNVFEHVVKEVRQNGNPKI